MAPVRTAGSGRRSGAVSLRAVVVVTTVVAVVAVAAVVAGAAGLAAGGLATARLCIACIMAVTSVLRRKGASALADCPGASADRLLCRCTAARSPTGLPPRLNLIGEPMERWVRGMPSSWWRGCASDPWLARQAAGHGLHISSDPAWMDGDKVTSGRPVRPEVEGVAARDWAIPTPRTKAHHR